MPTGRVQSILAQTGAALVIDEGHHGRSQHCTAVLDAHGAGASGLRGVHVGHHRRTQGRHRNPQALLAYIDDHAERMLRPAAERLGRPLCIGHAWSFAFDAAWQPLAASAVRPHRAPDRRDRPPRRRGTRRHHRPAGHRHARRHPVAVHQSAQGSDCWSARRWRVLALGGEAVGVGRLDRHPKSLHPSTIGGPQLLRSDRDDRRGRRRGHRRPRCAGDRISDPVDRCGWCSTRGCSPCPTGWWASCIWPVRR